MAKSLSIFLMKSPVLRILIVQQNKPTCIPVLRKSPVLVGLFCKRDLNLQGASESLPPRRSSVMVTRSRFNYSLSMFRFFLGLFFKRIRASSFNPQLILNQTAARPKSTIMIILIKRQPQPERMRLQGLHLCNNQCTMINIPEFFVCVQEGAPMMIFCYSQKQRNFFETPRYVHLRYI